MATQPTPHIPIQTEYDDPTIVYPCEDDEPLAETEYQYWPITYLVAALKAFFGWRDDVYAQGDMFVYFRMNDPRSVVAPDVFVVFGAQGNHKRNSWLIWREGGRQPNFVVEVASESTWQWDASGKRAIYAQMGVDEYWRFDPTGECFSPPLVWRASCGRRVSPHPSLRGRGRDTARTQRCHRTGHLRVRRLGTAAVQSRLRRMAAELRRTGNRA